MFYRGKRIFVKVAENINGLLLPKECGHGYKETWLIRGGVPPLVVARILGHCNMDMIMKIYDHTDVETLRNAIISAGKK